MMPYELVVCKICGKAPVDSLVNTNCKCNNNDCVLYGIWMPHVLWNFLHSDTRPADDKLLAEIAELKAKVDTLTADNLSLIEQVNKRGDR